VREGLNAAGIETGVHYPCPLHLQPALEYLGLRAGTLPATEQAADHVVSIPIFPEMTDAQVDRIIAAVQECLAGRDSRTAN
jgi:dTDP-4-amino-4,6-dideoxygalactose transaminase